MTQRGHDKINKRSLLQAASVKNAPSPAEGPHPTRGHWGAREEAAALTSQQPQWLPRPRMRTRQGWECGTCNWLMIDFLCVSCSMATACKHTFHLWWIQGKNLSQRRWNNWFSWLQVISTGTSETKSHPGLHQKQLGQQAEGGNSPPLLHSGESPFGVLCPALESSAQPGQKPVGAGPEGHKNAQRAGALLLWVLIWAERVGVGQPGEADFGKTSL